MDPIQYEFKTMSLGDMIQEFYTYQKIARGNEKMFNELVDLFWNNVARYTI